jgi:hypothetical protein
VASGTKTMIPVAMLSIRVRGKDIVVSMVLSRLRTNSVVVSTEISRKRSRHSRS